jgi:hypothetical protein
MTIFRSFFRRIRSLFRFTADDACALLSAAGFINFEVDKVLRQRSGEDIPEVDDNILVALDLDTECPVESWRRSQRLGNTFLWRKECDLSARDWNFLLDERLGRPQ